MRILALEPYFGGSHKAFLDGWSTGSRHDWTILSLPPNKWKWRMRHAAFSFAEQVTKREDNWDIIFCSDMLNLAEFIGLCPTHVRNLPSVVYFHENQLTYPVRFEKERDLHFGLTNFSSALAATEVWFNSAFHRDEFLEALPKLFKRMPDNRPLEQIESIRSCSKVYPQGIAPVNSSSLKEKKSGPLRLLWAARWEHDKNPEQFFTVVRQLKKRGLDFKIAVIVEQFVDSPSVFEQARQEFANEIEYWGYQQTREDYIAVLQWADVFVSTATHEFFGISVVEAVAGGAFPLLPNKLAYPEIFCDGSGNAINDFFYDGSDKHLIERLTELHERKSQDTLWGEEVNLREQIVSRYYWDNLRLKLDDAIEAVSP